MALKRKHKRVLITAGPTRAYIDSVRFISNVSSGRLGFELAKRFSQIGVEVGVISGPTCQPFEALPLKHFSRIETHREMGQEVDRLCSSWKPDWVIFAAAVLDFEPTKPKKGKTRSVGNWVVEFKPTPKIIDRVGRKFPSILRFGFKLEVSRKTSAKAIANKLIKEKKLSGVCVNFLSGVTAKEHRAYLLDSKGKSFEAHTKKQIATWMVKTCLRKDWSTDCI